MARRRDPVAVVASPPAAGRRDRGLIRQVPRAIDATVQASLLLTILFDESDEPAGDARAGCVKRVFATMGNDGEGAVGEYRKLWRSEEHTSELQSLMRISYAVFCLKKKKLQVMNVQ